MADGDGGQPTGKVRWLWALVAIGTGTGALIRYPLLLEESNLLFGILFAMGLAVIGWPLLVAEAALGRARQQNMVEALGPGRWSFAGYGYILGAILTTGLLAVIAGWALRLVSDSFSAGYTADPAQHIRLVTAGSDTLLTTLLVLAAAATITLATVRNGLRGPVKVTAYAIGLVLVGLAFWAILQSGAGSGRREFTTIVWSDLSGAMIVRAGLQALLPTLVGLGVVAAFSTQVTDRRLPNRAATLCVFLAAIPLVAGLMAASLATAHNHGLGTGTSLADSFTGLAELFAALPEQRGGAFAGLFFGAMLAAALVGIIALLEVPAAWMRDTIGGMTPRRACLASSLLALIVAVPLSFGLDHADALHLFLMGVVAPGVGLVTAINVGWIQPAVLHGFRVGEANTPLQSVLQPYLRFVAPPILAVLLVAGTLGWLVGIDAIEAGTTGLWRIVP